jgi:hypothetical protein
MGPQAKHNHKIGGQNLEEEARVTTTFQEKSKMQHHMALSSPH